MMWSSTAPTTAPLPRLSIQLYTISPLTVSLAELGTKLLHSKPVIGWGNARNWWPRVDVYGPLESMRACMQHHRLEKSFRQDTETSAHPLHIVPNWSHRQFQPYKNAIFIIDTPEWSTCLEKGILIVQFDAVIRDADRIFDEDMDEDDVVSIETYDYPEDPRIDRCVFDNKEWFREQQARMERGEFGDDHRRDLTNVWADLTLALWDCTYRLQICDDCDAGMEHSPCPVVEDMHYFNVEGQCIACSNFKGPWPEDDKEETERTETTRSLTHSPAGSPPVT